MYQVTLTENDRTNLITIIEASNIQGKDASYIASLLAKIKNAGGVTETVPGDNVVDVELENEKDDV